MKYIYRIFLCSILIASMASCKKFLEQKSVDEVIPKTTRDLSELLLGTGYLTSTSTIISWINLLDDNVEFNPNPNSVIGNSTTLQRFPVYTWQPTMYEDGNNLAGFTATSTGYGLLYSYVRGCNLVIDYTADAIGSQEDKDKLLAEALALRAFHYFHLVNLYGIPYNINVNAPGVPIKLTSAIQVGEIPRNTVGEVYEQILKDLKQAEAYLQKYPVYRGNFRINLPAVQIILSRVYLHMEQWENAVKSANLAIANGGLLTNLTQFNAPYPLLNYNNSEVVWLYGTRDATLSGSFKPSTDLLDLYQASDKRKTLFFATNFLTVTKYTASASTLPGKAIRTAEAFLNRAEANVEKAILGDASAHTAALNDLNEIRRNRITNYTNVNITNAVALREQIRAERRMELCFEDQRWFDLRRYGMPEIRHTYRAAVGEPDVTYVLKAKDPMYTLPIPSIILQNNAGVSQNPSAFEPTRVPN